MQANPILVESIRGEMVESFYRGAIAVVDAQGVLIDEVGDIRRPIYPRSAIKPLQATILVESGALDFYNLTDKELALACASHSGQLQHVSGVAKWLEQIGLNENALECGAHPPTHRESRNQLIRGNSSPRTLHNNCSGKHCGFLSVAKFRDYPTVGYINISHPVQQEVLSMLEELTEESLASPPPAVDGCGIPTPGISLFGIATAFSKLAAGKTPASLRIIDAMRKNPFLVGGTNRFCTAVPEQTHGKVLVKVGAEGVYAGIMLEGRKLGFALKMDDGTRTAAEVAAGGIVIRHGNLDNDEITSLRERFNPIVRNVAGRDVGVLRAVQNC